MTKNEMIHAITTATSRALNLILDTYAEPSLQYTKEHIQRDLDTKLAELESLKKPMNMSPEAANDPENIKAAQERRDAKRNQLYKEIAELTLMLKDDTIPASVNTKKITKVALNEETWDFIINVASGTDTEGKNETHEITTFEDPDVVLPECMEELIHISADYLGVVVSMFESDCSDCKNSVDVTDDEEFKQFLAHFIPVLVLGK